MRRGSAAVFAAAAMIGIISALPNIPSTVANSVVPTPDHVVVVMMENHSFAQIIDAEKAPFIEGLAGRGATFTNAFALTHPSQPNYFALFSGSTQSVTDDGFHMFDGPTLAGQLHAANKTFFGYIEAGSPRKHNPWESFADSQRVQRDLSTFPLDFTALPTVSFVVPNQLNDMHDGTIEEGDAWLRQHLGPYVEWCKEHNSLLIVTFDEDDLTGDNRILTIIFGDHVKPGRYGERINHYTVLRTIQAMYGLAPLAHSADQQPIDDIWRYETVPPTADRLPLPRGLLIQ